jgi:hypothetical protein
MKYKIHQIILNKAERAIVNEKGHYALDKQHRKIDMDFADNDEIKKLANESWSAGDYDYVADITADNLDEVYYVGNMDMLREENPQINDIGGMHSVSIGNIIEADGSKWVVAGYGFVQI